jgi:hypothetical protein
MDDAPLPLPSRRVSGVLLANNFRRDQRLGQAGLGTPGRFGKDRALPLNPARRIAEQLISVAASELPRIAQLLEEAGEITRAPETGMGITDTPSPTRE